MNIWHDVSPEKITPERFLAVIEIKKGCKNKYELDKETGLLRLDRVLYTSTHYPANYGFIPRTYARTTTPLDVLVLCSEAIEPLTLVACRPIGMIEMVDGEEHTRSRVAVPLGDPTTTTCSTSASCPRTCWRRWGTSSPSIKAWRAKIRSCARRPTATMPCRAIAQAIERYGEKFGAK